MTNDQLRAALASADSSSRLQTALTAGTDPDPSYVEVLVERCAIEPDFYVRDMLTWALTRHPADLTVPLLLEEAQSDVPQARSQALHSLSKVGDPRGWAAVTDAVLRTRMTRWRALRGAPRSCSFRRVGRVRWRGGLRPSWGGATAACS